MNIKLDKLIDNSFVFSIHPKRLDFFYSQWKAAGLPGLPKHIQGVQLAKCIHFNNIFKHNDNVKQHVSAMLGHFMAVAMARALKLPFVCVFEDDAVGCIDVKSKLEDILHCIPDDADIFILGNLKTFGIRSDLKNIIVPTKSFGMQSYIVFQNDYDYFLSQIMTDVNCGLCGYGKNVYMTKDILFCQYSAFKDLNKWSCKDKLGFLHSSLSKDYIDKHFKVHCHSMTFNGGRLGNQLYYALQAYIQNKTYVVTGVDSQTQYEDLLALGCKDLISDNLNGFTSKIDNYCQHVNKDFTIEQLNSFIDNVLLKSDFFKDMPLDSTSLYVNIRNGDYVSNSSIKALASFDRPKYLDDALKAASSTGMQKLVVVSDDIQACKQYESIFKKYASDIQYVHDNALDDFKLLCGAKNKIIMNSTFSIWSSFISNRLFKDSEKCIYAPSVWSVNSSIDKCFQHIATRANKEWNIVDVDFTPKTFKQDTIKNMKRYDIINIFIEKYNFQSYLEIGAYHNACFNKIFIVTKMSVDPDKNANPTFRMTSDEFFKQHADMKFDIVFIDGLHHSDQLLRDIENSLKCLNKGGVIVCHDCLPDNEHMQTYEKHSGAWTGDCWKAFAKYRKESPYECYVLDCDYGCGIIDTSIAKTSDTSMIKDSIADMTWQDFADNKQTWMNVKTQIM